MSRRKMTQCIFINRSTQNYVIPSDKITPQRFTVFVPRRSSKWFNSSEIHQCNGFLDKLINFIGQNGGPQ